MDSATARGMTASVILAPSWDPEKFSQKNFHFKEWVDHARNDLETGFLVMLHAVAVHIILFYYASLFKITPSTVWSRQLL